MAAQLYDKYLLMTYRHSPEAEKLLLQHHDCLKGLDVTILHSIVIQDILGITEDQVEKEAHITYVRSAHDAIAR